MFAIEHLVEIAVADVTFFITNIMFITSTYTRYNCQFSTF